MSENDPLKETKNMASVLSDVFKMAGENPETKQAARNLGKTAITITETVNTILLPIAAVNFAFKKAKDYFSTDFPKDILEKTQDIPVENIAEPKPSIAAPLLQGLAFSIEEPNLKEMFLNLLKSSMDNRTQNLVHPAYVDVIKQLTSQEANILSIYLKTNRNEFPIVRIVGKERNNSISGSNFKTLFENILKIEVESEELNLGQSSSIVDNWVRLGLFSLDYSTYLTDCKSYDWVESSKEYKLALIALSQASMDPEIRKGTLNITAFGNLFAKAIGVRK
ncbi:MAG: DUF4393 domain-containing protein [Elstera sp.]